MLTSEDVARYFLSKLDEDAGDAISNLKLQKLVYYAQGLYLAMHDRPLFAEPIEAWQHGPVVPQLYHEFKRYGSAGIPAPVHLDFSKFSADDAKFLDDVYAIYGQFSAWKLRNMTHEESPWKNTEPGSVISQEAMKEYFKTQVYED